MPESGGNTSGIRVEPRTAPRRRWPQVTLRSQSRKHNVRIFYSKRLVNASRAHIANAHADVLSHLSRNRQIPLHDVVPARARVKVSLPEYIRRRSNIERGVRKGVRRQCGGDPQLEKRSRKKFIEHDSVGERKHIEHSKSSTQHGFCVTERVPGETHARFKIAQCRV